MRPWRRAAAATAVVASLAGCTPGDEPDAVDDAARAEELTACVVPTPQLVEAGATAGQFVGFDVAVLEHVATALERELTFVEVGFDELVSGVALNGMECDIGAGGVVDHDGLDAVVAVSDPYRAIDRLVVAVGAAGPVEPEAVTGTVGFVEGGVAQDGVDALTNAELVPYPSPTDLERGIGTTEQGAWLVSIAERERLEGALALELGVLSRVPSGERSVLLLPLGVDDDTLEAVDAALATLRGTPEHAELRARWLDT